VGVEISGYQRMTRSDGMIWQRLWPRIARCLEHEGWKGRANICGPRRWFDQRARWSEDDLEMRKEACPLDLIKYMIKYVGNLALRRLFLDTNIVTAEGFEEV
jgi:hypothetical protein